MAVVEFFLLGILLSCIVKFRSSLIFFYRVLVFLFNMKFRNGVYQRAIVSHVRKHAVHGDPENVLQVIDKFASERMWSWQVGEVKGKILDDAVRKADPLSVLELGSFCGYSSVRIARLLKDAAQLVTVEIDPISAKTASEIIDFSGLSSKVKIINGSSSDVIKSLKEDYDVEFFQLVFFDHHKDLYVTDLKKLEEVGLIRTGTVLVADNMRVPGIPEYAKYIQESDCYDNVIHHSYTGTMKDDVWVTIKIK